MGKLKLPLCRIIEVLAKSKEICIDKIISFVVQIYLAVLAIANYFRKLCLTAQENHVA